MKVVRAFLFLLSAIGSSAAWASTVEGCGPELVCASDPAEVLGALKVDGREARLEQNSERPVITVGQPGAEYRIRFSGCAGGKHCSVMQLSVLFRHGESNALDLAGEWNRRKRFSTMVATGDGNLWVTHELSTEGGMTHRNLTDILNWWTATLDMAVEHIRAGRKAASP